MSLAQELENTENFWNLYHNKDMEELADILIEEKAIFNEDDFAKQSGQIKKSGLVKLILWTRSRKSSAQNAARDTR